MSGWDAARGALHSRSHRVPVSLRSHPVAAASAAARPGACLIRLRCPAACNVRRVSWGWGPASLGGIGAWAHAAQQDVALAVTVHPSRSASWSQVVSTVNCATQSQGNYDAVFADTAAFADACSAVLFDWAYHIKSALVFPGRSKTPAPKESVQPCFF